MNTPEPVAVWLDGSGRLMSDLGSVDTGCHVAVRAHHCPQRENCVLAYRAPGPRLLYGELMSDLDDEAGVYLETHAKHLAPDLISLSVDHVGADGPPGSWRYRLLPMRWKTSDGWRDTDARLAVWPD
ncbi:hypothetical protein [Mycolicibacterium smegmatis]|uniref:Uncharacterized protein n=1 Tax=Mycolicibacterium smegmatis (strain ATCC 700084 / mc(2)155) TaxID=246196 RepID=I7FJK2_MYCS2|nr:hypothetical protein [Mycolicibacterium smegmatis]AFP41510.1 hypothetical protein MSMEI_5066 [Mycolicibacterium smegmatis MC2 155]AIU10236.1 hypothetical protein LJ00_25725 [Mycolicibacterium smegmatis MC2 155]AIU16861.1 hypothetical protein LI99_25730 [Mycolicibacterium smegmatis]AIU23484.1 hypothetical protein LI98_25735 [Mycolicibacterium smegmatis]MBE9618993.1 hypothetical protein [Mycolicibacterium smegmatis]